MPDESEFALDIPATRRGCALIWNARTVNLRPFQQGAWPGAGAASGAFASAAGAGAGDGSSSGAAGGVAADAPPFGEDLARRLAARLQPPLDLLLRVSGPVGWPADLFPYQLSGIRALLAAPHLLLGDEMGLGKTIMAIAALRLLFLRRQVGSALIVVPAGLLDQWRRELSRWAPELRVLPLTGPIQERAYLWRSAARHVTLISYDTLRSDAGGAVMQTLWDVAVLDEAQRIKNRDTDVAGVCKRLRRKRSWALTGTPLENREEDVRSLLEFVTDRKTVLADGPVLRGLLAAHQLRRRKADVLQDLPPKIGADVLLSLTGEQRRAYDAAEQEGIIALRNGTDLRIESILALIARLKQICNFAPRNNESAKMNDLRQRIEELAATGQQALVFSQYVSDDAGGARLIARYLKEFRPLVYAGDTDADERSRIVARFREEPGHTVLVLSLRAGGQGLNLQNASYVFHFDRWWNPAAERQAEDRAHRLGQPLPVHVYRYIMRDTIEERIDRILREKMELFDEVVEGASLDLGRLLSKKDLYGLFGLEQ